MTMDLTIMLLSLLTLGNYWVRKSILYPPVLFCSVWLIDMIIIRLHIVRLYALHDITFGVVDVGAALFSVGGAAVLLVPRELVTARFSLFRGSMKPRGNFRVRIASISKHAVAALILFGFALSVRGNYELAQQAGGVGALYFANARAAMVQALQRQESAPIWLMFLPPLSTFLVLLLQLDGEDRIFWGSALVVFIENLLSGARGGILYLFAPITCIHLILSQKEGVKAAFSVARWPLLSFAVLFGGMLFADKGIAIAGLDENPIQYAAESVVDYVVGPVAALDHVLTNPLEYSGAPNHTFQSFLRLGSMLGLVKYTPPPTQDEFIMVPFATNVYTVYKFFIVDFGVYATLLIMGIIGFIQTMLFYRAHAGNFLSLYLFALTIFASVTAIFDDAYSRFGLFFLAWCFGIAFLMLRMVAPRTSMHSLRSISADVTSAGGIP